MKLRTILPAALLAIAAIAMIAATKPPPPEDRTTTVTSDGEGQMVSNDNETTITFRDNVVVTGTDLKLTCDYLKVIVLRIGDPTATIGKLNKFKSLLATGNVHFVQGARDAACGRAEVLPGQDRIIMTENPVVVDRDQNTRFRGEKITILSGQKQVLVEKPILEGPPIKDFGPLKGKPTDTPAPTAAPKTGT